MQKISKRKRGVILTRQGLEKLRSAKSEAEFKENKGDRYTLEAMGERTGLAVDTLMKVFTCETAVDKQTLKRCFDAFSLALESADYFLPKRKVDESKTLHSSYLISDQLLKLGKIKPSRTLELPGGPVPLGSLLYIERFSTESHYYELILQPGVFLHIPASRQMGKTSLLTRILYHVRKKGCYTVILNFQLIDTCIFSNLDKFLQCFCAYISQSIGLPHQLISYWDDRLGSNCNATHYFENYLLAKTHNPLILALDEMDYIFQYPEITVNFFGLLRSWYEKTKYSNDNLWQKLRIIMVYATDLYIQFDHQNPLFNIGSSIDLPELTPVQVQELANRHGLEWSMEQVNQLMALTGGHPHRVRLALYDICCKNSN